VREAIQRLAWEGLLDVRPRAGIAIAPLHPGDWLRVLDARRGVEVVLARSAARFVTREAADLFHEAALAMQKAVISGNVLAFIQADKALDEALAMAADNPFAARLAAPLQTHSRRFWFRYKADTGLAESAEHHVALIRSILDGDEEAAAKDAKRLMALLRGHAEVAATRLTGGQIPCAVAMAVFSHPSPVAKMQLRPCTSVTSMDQVPLAET